MNAPDTEASSIKSTPLALSKGNGDAICAPYVSSPLSRRRFLRGAAVVLALPAMECATPVFSRATEPAVPRRMLLISNNLGVLPSGFFPAQSGPAYGPSAYLKELSAFREDFTVLSGLSHPSVVGGHSTENCFLTGARDPTRSGFRNTISLDQFASEKLGQQTRFQTLNLGVNIDRANRSLSWTRDGVLLPAEDSPSAVFRRMFIQGNAAEVAQRIQRLRERGSVLDALGEDLRSFQHGLAARDRDRLDQYLTSVRELEGRLSAAGEWEAKMKPTTQTPPPSDLPDRAKFFPKIQLMLQMARLALASDSTRIITVMIDGFATPVFEIDESLRSKEAYHGLSHHGQSPSKLADLEKIDLQQMRQLRTLLAGLSEAAVADGTRLLDHTMVLFGSNLGDANVHNNTNLPILLAGGGFRHGTHLAFDRTRNTPLCNLFVSMLQRLGVETAAFGSSTGPLAHLSA